MGDKRCDLCAQWRPHLNGRSGDCLNSGHYSTTYKQVGGLHGADIYESTKIDYWCTEFKAANLCSVCRVPPRGGCGKVGCPHNGWRKHDVAAVN